MDKVNVDLAAAGWDLKNATSPVIAEAVEREQPRIRVVQLRAGIADRLLRSICHVSILRADGIKL
ncbi:DNA polymerase III subunit theta [Shigella flexneri]